MSVTITSLTPGMMNYIAVHNANYANIKAEVDAIEELMDAVAAPTEFLTWVTYDKDGPIGGGSYHLTISTIAAYINVSSGVARVSSEYAFQDQATNLTAAGSPSHVGYVVIPGDGIPTLSMSSVAGDIGVNLAEYTWSGTVCTEVHRIIDVLMHPGVEGRFLGNVPNASLFPANTPVGFQDRVMQIEGIISSLADGLEVHSSSGLNVTHKWGRAFMNTSIVEYSPANYAAPASQTNYFYLSEVMSFEFGSVIRAGVIPLAQVHAGASAITSIVDIRPGLWNHGSNVGGGGGGNGVTAISADSPTNALTGNVGLIGSNLGIVVNTATNEIIFTASEAGGGVSEILPNSFAQAFMGVVGLIGSNIGFTANTANNQIVMTASVAGGGGAGVSAILPASEAGINGDVGFISTLGIGIEKHVGMNQVVLTSSLTDPGVTFISATSPANPLSGNVGLIGSNIGIQVNTANNEIIMTASAAGDPGVTLISADSPTNPLSGNVGFIGSNIGIQVNTAKNEVVFTASAAGGGGGGVTALSANSPTNPLIDNVGLIGSNIGILVNTANNEIIMTASVAGGGGAGVSAILPASEAGINGDVGFISTLGIGIEKHVAMNQVVLTSSIIDGVTGVRRVEDNGFEGLVTFIPGSGIDIAVNTATKAFTVSASVETDTGVNLISANSPTNPLAGNVGFIGSNIGIEVNTANNEVIFTASEAGGGITLISANSPTNPLSGNVGFIGSNIGVEVNTANNEVIFTASVTGGNGGGAELPYLPYFENINRGYTEATGNDSVTTPGVMLLFTQAIPHNIVVKGMKYRVNAVATGDNKMNIGVWDSEGQLVVEIGPHNNTAALMCKSVATYTLAAGKYWFGWISMSTNAKIYASGTAGGNSLYPGWGLMRTGEVSAVLPTSFNPDDIYYSNKKEPWIVLTAE